MKRIYLLVETGSGEKRKTFFKDCGIAFEPNRDNSVNFKLDLFPGLTFQMREPKNEEK